MAEFDAFESAGQQPPQEEDPAAEFLAREQDQLAELGDETAAAAGFTAPQEDMMGGETVDTQPEAVACEASEPEVAAAVPDESNPASAIDDVLAEFDGPGQTGGNVDDMGDMGDMGTMGDFGTMGDMGDATESQDMFSAISQADEQMAEPEKIRLWRIEHEERLTKKDSEEVEKMEDWRQIARQELEDWYKHRDEQLEKTKIGNREGEAAFIKERDETLPGQTWEKICRLCEFNPKNNKSTKDNSRMRSILLQLKQTPVKIQSS